MKIKFDIPCGYCRRLWTETIENVLGTEVKCPNCGRIMIFVDGGGFEQKDA